MDGWTRLNDENESFLLFRAALCYEMKIILKIIIHLIWLFLPGKDWRPG